MTEQVPSKMTKDQLKLVALKQRIGEITSDYEDKIADIRAYVTQLQEQYEDIIKNNEKDMESLQTQLRAYQEAEKDVLVKEDSSNKSAK